MIIKRFKGNNIRQALQAVRAELGPDAVILSNTPAGTGVEVLAATDTDHAAKTSASAPTTVTPREPAFADAANGIDDRPGDYRGFERNAIRDTPAPGYTNRNNSPPGRDAFSATEPEHDTQAELSGEVRALRRFVERHMAGLAWGDYARNNPDRAALMERLLNLGLPAAFCDEIANTETNNRGGDDAWKHAMMHVMNRLPVSRETPLETGGAIALVGPTGVGKTTTVAKLAGQYSLRNGPGSVALITVDGQRIGTQEQLRAFGRILDIPVAYAADHEELQAYLARFSRQYGLVIVDSGGISHRDPNLMSHMSLFNEASAVPLSTYLVVAANTQPRAVDETFAAFTRFPIAGTVISKLDEAESLGGLISSLIKHELPLTFTTDGQQVPDDLAPGDAYQLIRLAIDRMRDEQEPNRREINGLTFGPLMVERYA